MPVMKTALLLPSEAFSFCNVIAVVNKKNLSGLVHCDCLPDAELAKQLLIPCFTDFSSSIKVS